MPVSQKVLRQLLSLAAEANKNYDWWCEAIWISDELDEQKSAFGCTKLFCNIDDMDTDNYMAYLDACEIIKFLAKASNRTGIGWRLEIEGAPFGSVTKAGPDDELRGNIATFLELFPGNFDSLKSRPRQEILADWPDR